MRAPRLPALITLVLLLAGCAGTEEPGEGAAPTAATSGAPSEEPTPPPSEEPSAPPSEEPSAPPSEEAVSPDEVPGAVTVDAEGTVAEVVAGITGRIEEGPPMLVTTVDHAANAAGAGLDLPATTLLVFGAPPVGTPLMQSQRTVGIDLPQKLLVWDDGGQTRVTWNTAEYLAARHGLEGVDEQLGMIEMLLPMLATGDAEVEVAPPAALPDEGEGLMTVDAEGTVAEVVAGVTGRIEEGPPMLVTTVDHAANAAGAGLDLPATTLLVFGAPPVGTPLMQSQRTVGIDLPQKLLVWDDGGQTRVTWNTAEYLAARHGLEGVDEQLGMIEMLLPMLATGG